MDATVPEDDAGRLIRTHVREFRPSKSSAIFFLAALVAFAGITLSGIGTSAAADPSPDDWYRLRVCESGNNYAINTGNGYYGAYQFDVGTWRSIGGSGYPNDASPATQDALALLLWQQRGWAPWACARILGLTGSPSAAPGPPAPPVGNLDVVAASGGNATVAGWAFDPNSPGTSIQTHVYVNGAGYPFVADGGRPDVNAAYGITGGHGFSVTVPLQLGSNNVCAYSIGVASGNNALVGCRRVQYFTPVGNFDFAAVSGGIANVAGWAFDPAESGRSISVDVYVNGQGVRLAADEPRADVNAVMGVSGQHGFSGSVTLQSGDNSICAYAIGFSGTNPTLGCRTVRLSPPIGSFDFAANAGGVATIAGWALDPSAPAQSIAVHAYVNGVAYALMADGPRADVNAVMGVTGQHGFSGSMPLQAGANAICVYAIGVTSGNNPFLGCRSVAVAPPIGSFDFAVDAGGVANVSGWAVDPNSSGRSISVDVYVNGKGVRLTADKPRTDVNAVMGVSGQHGFADSVQLQPGSNTICAYAISLTAGGNPLLGCRQVQSVVQAAAVQQAAPEAAVSAPTAQAPATVVAQQQSSAKSGPGSTTAGPGSTTAGPGSTTAGPGSTTAAPGSTTAGPGSTTAAPGSTTATSGAAPPAPGSTTATSGAAPPVAPSPATVASAPDLPQQTNASVSPATAPVPETSTSPSSSG